MKEILINKNQLEMARVDDPSNIPFKNKKFDEFIEEGIDFNKKSMTVWFTPTDTFKVSAIENGEKELISLHERLEEMLYYMLDEDWLCEVDYTITFSK